ncbi:arylacetamide deacetylase-like 4 [Hoplias malabaricus]|uniref:arylacetamide deacetylase-like 4 n=1 Tax=Hoplias malabaricus TaxID=27720 RepID=UPI003461B5AA
MEIVTAILIIGFAALAAAFCLLLIGLVYSEAMNSEIPPGVSNSRKLHAVHCGIVGTAVVGRILERLGLCSQVSFTRWCTCRFMGFRPPPPSGLRIKDLTFGGVPVRVYEPTATSAQKRRGMMYFHGGGWVMGSIDLYDEICWHIAKETDTTVLSVGYRLAPEHRFPAHLDDCEAATLHFLSVAEAEFGVDPARVVLGGDSAGGNLTAALSQRLVVKRDRNQPSPLALVLIYPALQMADFNLPSYQQNHAVPLLFRARTAFYYLQYLNGDMSVCEDVLAGRHVPADLKQHYKKWLDPANLPAQFRERCDPHPEVATDYDGEVYHIIKDGLQPEFSPLLAEDDVLRLMPPTFILTCEYDVLRDDGILFQKRLKDLGVEVTWINISDGFHGILSFFTKGKAYFSSGAKAMEHIVNYIKAL